MVPRRCWLVKGNVTIPKAYYVPVSIASEAASTALLREADARVIRAVCCAHWQRGVDFGGISPGTAPHVSPARHAAA